MVNRIGERREKGLCIGNLRKLRVFSVDHQVHVLCGLLLHCCDDFGMAVPEVSHADARDEVHVGLALRIEEVDSLGPHKSKSQRAECGGGEVVQETLAEVHSAKVRGG